MKLIGIEETKDNKLFSLRVNWTIKDAIFVLVATDVFFVTVALVFLKKIEQNPFIAIFFTNIFTLYLISFILTRRKEQWGRLGFTKTNNARSIIAGILIGTLLFLLCFVLFVFSY